MQRDINILKELAEVAPRLEGISPSMPHQVPDGYFESLPLLCLTRVSADSGEGRVPVGYFESLPELMLSKVKAISALEDELDEVAPLLKTISRQPVGYVPAGYFEELGTVQAARWFGNERLNELKDLAPSLLQVSQGNPGYVPAGYFEDLPANVLSKLQAPVRSIAPVAVRRAMAVAAAVLVMAGLWFGYNAVGETSASEPAGAALADNGLKETPQIEAALHNIDAESIALYLNESSATPIVSFSNPDDVEAVIKTLNSETLENFLEIMPRYPESVSGDAKS